MRPHEHASRRGAEPRRGAGTVTVTEPDDAETGRAAPRPAEPRGAAGEHRGAPAPAARLVPASPHGGDEPPSRARGGDPRLAQPALRRGLRLRCPACGRGPVLHRYLKVRESCPTCGEDLSHARADDGPAWLTILIVGHVLALVMHVYYAALRPEPLEMALVLSAGVTALTLFLLPRAKGLIVAFQWQRRLGGFGDDEDAQSAVGGAMAGTGRLGRGGDG